MPQVAGAAALAAAELPWSEGLVLVLARRAFGASCLASSGVDRLGYSHRLALGVASQPWDSCRV